MKKNLMRITSLLLVFCLMFLSACEMPGNKAPETPEEFWARPHEWNLKGQTYTTSSEYGYYFFTHGYLTYFDYATREKFVLCNKVGCKHDNGLCEAYISTNSMFCRDDKFYLIIGKDDGCHILECDLDATNRQSKIVLMKEEMEKGNAVGVGALCVNGDDLYYRASYLEPGDDSGEKKDPIKAVRHVNLKTWTDEEICRSVENEYKITTADADGVLIFEAPDPYVLTNVDLSPDAEWRKNSDRVQVLSKEEMQSAQVNLFYWNSGTKDLLNLYQNNYLRKTYVAAAYENYIYIAGVPDGTDALALERMDMRTGKSELLWTKTSDTGDRLSDCYIMNNHLHLTIVKPDDITCITEVYTIKDFKKVTPASLTKDDIILFEDEHGYIIDRTTEKLPQTDVAYIFFLPAEEADKENPECVIL